MALTRKGRLLAEINRLQDVLRTPMAGIGHRRIGVFSPQATKTSTLAMCLWVLAEARGEQVLGVDANPDKGKLRDRLCPPQAVPPARGLTDLIQQLQQDRQVAPEHRLLRNAAALRPALEDTPARMLRLISDLGTIPEAIAEHTIADYAAVFDLLGEWFPIIGIDIGRSQVTPATRASMDVADHLLVPFEADGSAMNLTVAALEDLVRFGHGELVRRATMVVTGQDPASNPDTAIGHLDRFAALRRSEGLQPLWRNVVTVPYDQAAGARGQIIFGNLAPATRLAYTRVGAHVAESFAEPPVGRGSDDESTDPDGWFGTAPRRSRPDPVVRELRTAPSDSEPGEHGAAGSRP